MNNRFKHGLIKHGRAAMNYHKDIHCSHVNTDCLVFRDHFSFSLDVLFFCKLPSPTEFVTCKYPTRAVLITNSSSYDITFKRINYVNTLPKITASKEQSQM